VGFPGGAWLFGTCRVEPTGICIGGWLPPFTVDVHLKNNALQQSAGDTASAAPGPLPPPSRMYCLQPPAAQPPTFPPFHPAAGA
jgi:hypothetical protein